MRLSLLRHWILLALLTAVGAAVGLALFERAGDHSGASDKQSRGRTHELAGNFRPDGTKLDSCVAPTPAARLSCRSQAFGNIAVAEGPPAALAQLAGVARADQEVYQQAHQIAHAVGAAALYHYKDDVGQAFADGTEVGSGGYYHGVLLRALLEGKRTELPDLARAACGDGAVRTSEYLLSKCAHAAGHAFMIHTGNDLPGALSSCEQMGGELEITSCGGGVVMENYAQFMGVRTATPTTWLKPDDLMYPCTIVAQRFTGHCYTQVVTRIGPARGWDWSRIAADCRTLEPQFERMCFDSYGGWLLRMSQRDPYKVATGCVQAGTSAGLCARGAARYYANDDTTGRDVARFCAALADSLRPDCRAGAEQIQSLRTTSPRTVERAS